MWQIFSLPFNQANLPSLAKEGEDCEASSECGFDLACGIGKCQKMFTKESGEICDNWQLCKTGFV